MKCKDVMTSDLSLCVGTDMVSGAARLMKEGAVGPVPVVEDLQSRKVEGILTDRDIAVKVVAEGHDPASTEVRDVMTRRLIACGPEDDIKAATEAMAREQVRRVLVVDQDGTLQGIISQADVARRIGDTRKTGSVVRDISRPGAQP